MLSHEIRSHSLCGRLAADGAAPSGVVFSSQEVFHQLLQGMNLCAPPKMWFQQLSLLWLLQWVTAQTRGLPILAHPTNPLLQGDTLACFQPCSQDLTRDLPLGFHIVLSHFSNFIEKCLVFSVTCGMKDLGTLQSLVLGQICFSGSSASAPAILPPPMFPVIC